MKVIFLATLLLSSLLYARENPFQPINIHAENNNSISIPLLNIKTSKAFITEVPLMKEVNCSSSSVEGNTSIAIIPPKKPLITKVVKSEKKVIPEKKETTKKSKKLKRTKKSKIQYRFITIFSNYFLKVETDHKSFKIITEDSLIQKRVYSTPQRVAFDFDRLQYFHTKNVKFKHPFAKKIKFGSHHEFYRITIELNHYKHYKLLKKPYGYLITFY